MSPPSSLRTFLSVIAGKYGRVAPLWVGQEEAMAEFMAAGACGDFLMSRQARKQRGLRNQGLSCNLQRSILVGLFLPSKPSANYNGKKAFEPQAYGVTSDSDCPLPLWPPRGPWPAHGVECIQFNFESPDLNTVQKFEIQEPGEVAQW